VKRIGNLHVLTDTELQTRYSAVELARLALLGGADVIQFRQKTGSTRQLIAVARELRRLCQEAGVTLIVNDRVDVALAAEAHGVHLGQDDFPIRLARDLLGPDRIVGGSASTADEARSCVAEGADYVGFGPVYPTSSKPDAGTAAGLEGLRSVTSAVPVPVIAIGGLDAGKTPQVIRSGAHGIAVISAVCCQDDPADAARALRRALGTSGRGHRG
jgi:thiamine-phosphate pyrophosphorylase